MSEKFIPEQTVDQSEPLVTPESIEQDFEGELIPSMRNLAEAAQQLEDAVANAELSSVLQESVTGMRERLKRIAFRLVLVHSLLLSSSSFADVISRRESEFVGNDDTETLVGPPKPEYSAPDRETAHLLNYIVGRDTLSEDEVERLLKESWVTDFDLPTTLPETIGLEEMADSVVNKIETEEDLDQLALEGLKESLMGEKEYFPRFLEENDDLYEVIWQLEFEVGMPRIRFAFIKDGRSYYDPYDNRIVLNFSTTIIDTVASFKTFLGLSLGVEYKHGFDPSNILAEYAHAQQWSQNREGYNERHAKDSKQTLARADSLKISRYDSQKYEYGIPGTVEHEAHKLILPQLTKRFGELMQARKSSAFKAKSQ